MKMNVAQIILGKDKITAICKKHNLNTEEENIINEILNEWDDLARKNDEKIEVVAEKISHSACRREFFDALLEISAEFAIAEIRKKMH